MNIQSQPNLIKPHQTQSSHQASSCISDQAQKLIQNHHVKCDQGSMTDPIICNCANDIIPKLKQKAHKSFMQVIQIESLYKEEIQELKKYYEESLKSIDKNCKIKEDTLSNKCKSLQSEIQKFQENYQKQKNQQIFTTILQNPFDLSTVSIAQVSSPPDQIDESILNIRQFVQTTNLKESSLKLQNDVKSIVIDIRKWSEQERGCGQLCDEGRAGVKQKNFVVELELEIIKIFQFINCMIENTINAHEKYNDIKLTSIEAENRYTKLSAIFQSGQKQLKFMSDHIKRISEDKIRMEKKNIQLERSNKSLQETINSLKKTMEEKQMKVSKEKQNKNFQIYQNYSNLIDDEESDLSKNSLLSNRTNNRLLTRSAQSNGLQRILPRSLNFKKKSPVPKQP